MLTTAIIAKFDEALSRGLCSGVGSQEGQMCIEAAICYALGLPHGDDPQCVEPEIRSYKIRLNDSTWSSPQARAAGLRDLGIAQIGSKGVVDGAEFSRLMTRKTIQILIPALFREVLAHDAACMAAAETCEKQGTAASAASNASYAASAASAASNASYAASAAYAANAAASYAADKYLSLSALLALETLRELKSPGCEWLEAL